MALTVTLPDGFQFVGLSLLSTVYLLAYQVQIVTRYRKRAGVKYPQVYAEKADQDNSLDAMRFNCAQRAHQNTLENIPIVYASTIMAGLKYPHLAASICAAFVVGRIAYTYGYTTGDPKKRGNILYYISAFGVVGQILTASYVAVEMALTKVPSS